MPTQIPLAPHLILMPLTLPLHLAVFVDLLMAHNLTNPIKAVDSVKAQYDSYANDFCPVTVFQESASPVDSVSQDFLLALSGHMLPPNAMAKIGYWTLDQKVECFSSQ